MHARRRRTAAWVLVALLGLALYVRAVGVGAVAAALVYRAVAFWLPTLGGGVVTGVVLAASDGASPDD